MNTRYHDEYRSDYGRYMHSCDKAREAPMSFEQFVIQSKAQRIAELEALVEAKNEIIAQQEVTIQKVSADFDVWYARGGIAEDALREIRVIAHNRHDAVSWLQHKDGLEAVSVIARHALEGDQ